MSILSQQEKELSAFAEDAGIPLHKCANGLDEEPPHVRKDRILAVRRQLAEGTYDLDERLDAVLDRLLVVINT